MFRRGVFAIDRDRVPVHARLAGVDVAKGIVAATRSWFRSRSRCCREGDDIWARAYSNDQVRLIWPPHLPRERRRSSAGRVRSRLRGGPEVDEYRVAATGPGAATIQGRRDALPLDNKR